MTEGSRTDSKLARGLAGLFADTYVLYNATQNAHWNVEGPQFKSLHELFEEQYGELAEAVDTLAERIRTLGYYTPGTLDQIVSATRIHQDDTRSDAEGLLDGLIEAHQVVLHRIQEIQPLAEKQVDEATFDLLVERQRVHEMATWFLRSQAGHKSRSLDTATLRNAASR